MNKVTNIKELNSDFDNMKISLWNTGKTFWKIIKVLFVLWIILIISAIIFGVIVNETPSEKAETTKYYQEHPEEHPIFSDPSIPDDVKSLLRDSYTMDKEEILKRYK